MWSNLAIASNTEYSITQHCYFWVYNKEKFLHVIKNMWASIFIIAKLWKQFKHPSTMKCIWSLSRQWKTAKQLKWIKSIHRSSNCIHSENSERKKQDIKQYIHHIYSMYTEYTYILYIIYVKAKNTMYYLWTHTYSSTFFKNANEKHTYQLQDKHCFCVSRKVSGLKVWEIFNHK